MTARRDPGAFGESAARRVLGVDFTSAPRRAKAITVAHCRLRATVLDFEALERIESFTDFEALLKRAGPWIGGFDFPFGLPTEMVRDLGLPRDWRALVAHCARMTRAEFRTALDAYRASRPAGRKYAHRATDLPAGSSSPMKLVNPPVALMFHEGARRLAAAGLHVPRLASGDRSRIALEAYPGLLARKIVRGSYKSDTASKQTRARTRARKAILAALRDGTHPLGLRVRFAATALERAALADGTGDSLDAILCAVQAAWAATQPEFGIPQHLPRCEGWIVSA